MDASGWIARLGLTPHPEGGHYREVYRSAGLIPRACLPPGFGGPRALATSIYYLLRDDVVSLFHRLRSDEVWTFYQGSRLTLAVIRPDGALEEIVLGPHPEEGELLQAVIPAGQWFGAWVAGRGAFALAGCFLAPGFDTDDFELAGRRELLSLYPEHRAAILRLTR